MRKSPDRIQHDAKCSRQRKRNDGKNRIQTRRLKNAADGIGQILFEIFSKEILTKYLLKNFKRIFLKNEATEFIVKILAK